MNWDAIGALAELFGALAVVVSLLYLASQIRQNTTNLRFAARQSLTSQNADYTRMLLEPDLGALFSRAIPVPIALQSLENAENLSDEELTRLVRMVYLALINLESQYNAWRTGALTEEEWAPARALVDMYVGSRAVRDIWSKGARELHGPSFAHFVDERIR
jgi:hypothetical protein